MRIHFSRKHISSFGDPIPLLFSIHIWKFHFEYNGPDRVHAKNGKRAASLLIGDTGSADRLFFHYWTW